jgi:dienelactone hydrolase
MEQEFGGYLATPEMGAGPAVIVIPEDRELCDLLAAEGFTALGTAGAGADAIDFLKPHPAVRGQGIGVVGLYPGAGPALRLATHRPEDVVAVVVYSDTVPAEAEQLDSSPLTAAVQGHFVGDQSLADPGVTAEFFTYPTAGPRFFEEDGDEARQAWIRTLEFLRKHLG